jgi:hypothetical protein
MPRGRSGVYKISTLKIDRDCFVESGWVRDYVRTIITTCKMFDVRVRSIKMSRSKRKGNHFYIEINPPVEATFANQLQYLLGDDGLRVDRNRARIEAGFNGWSKLFERANAKLRTIYRTSRFWRAEHKSTRRR